MKVTEIIPLPSSSDKSRSVTIKWRIRGVGEDTSKTWAIVDVYCLRCDIYFESSKIISKAGF